MKSTPGWEALLLPNMLPVIFVPDVLFHDDVKHLDAGIDGGNLQGGDQKLFHVARLTVHGVHFQAVGRAHPRLRKIVLQFKEAIHKLGKANVINVGLLH